jgi:putative transferase (TIGR04331 family)
MKYYLGLIDDETLPDGYDCYVFAGDYCISGVEWCEKNHKNYEVVSELTYSGEQVHEICRYLEDVKQKAIAYSAKILNEYHGTDYSEYKWNILLNNWLEHFLPSIYDKYLNIKYFLKDGRKFDTLLYDTDIITTTLDHNDYFDMARNDFEFNRYEYSILFNYINNDKDEINKISMGRYKRRDIKKGDYLPLPEHIKKFVKEYSDYKEESGVQDEIVIQSDYIKFTLSKKIMEKKYGRITEYFRKYNGDVRNTLDSDIEPDKEWRTSYFNMENGEDEFISLIYRILPYFLPIAYVEEYDTLKRIALENYKWGMNPRVVIYETEGIFGNEMLKVYLMNIDTQNVHKVGFQHALGYNVGGIDWYRLSEFQMCDEFYMSNISYLDKYNIKITRMPYILFFRSRLDYCNDVEVTDRIIFGSYSSPRNRCELSAMAWNWKPYRDGAIEFLKMLNKDVISEVAVRLMPYYKTDWNEESIIKNEIPNIAFDDNKVYFLDSIKSAKLVVTHVWSSLAMESIAYGKPVISLYGPGGSAFEINENYRDVEDLIRVGIIAGTPERCAAIVNEIDKDVESWWNEPERQEVVRKFRDKYMYFPSNAEEIWVDKVTSYLE